MNPTGKPSESSTRMPTPEEIEKLLRNAPTPAEIAESAARWAELSQRYHTAIQNAESGLKELYALATGSDEGMAASAARELLRILQNTLLGLNAARSGNGTPSVWMGKGPNPSPSFCGDPVWPPAFQKLARERESWPILFHVHPDRFRVLTEKVIVGLKVGSESGLNVSAGKIFSLSKPANIAVINLKQYIEDFRKREFNGEIFGVNGRALSPSERVGLQTLVRTFAKLPPLSRKAAVLKAWQKAGDDLIPFFYGEDFEKHSSLRGILTGTKTETRASRFEEEASRWWDRDVISKAVKAAWKSVAALEQDSEK